jgi:hypothetical protein
MRLVELGTGNIPGQIEEQFLTWRIPFGTPNKGVAGNLLERIVRRTLMFYSGVYYDAIGRGARD